MSDIEDKVCRVIQSRADRGLVKYGVSMARSDLTRADWLRHARDEALDLAIYLQRLIYEESSGPDASGSKPRQPGQSGGGSSPSRLPAPQPEAVTYESTTRFRKRPVVVHAVRLSPGCREEIHTLEGVMVAEPGDWIITGVNGERYPCKDDIFRATYEPVAAESAREEESDA